MSFKAAPRHLTMLFSRASLWAQSPAKALRSHLSSSIIVLCSPFGAAAGFGRLLRPAGRGAPPPKSGTAGRRGFFRGKGKKRGEAPGLSRMIKSSCAVPARGIVRQCLKKFVCGTAPRTGRSGKKSGGPGVRKSAEGKRKIRAFRHRERPGRHSARPLGASRNHEKSSENHSRVRHARQSRSGGLSLGEGRRSFLYFSPFAIAVSRNLAL